MRREKRIHTINETISNSILNSSFTKQPNKRLFQTKINKISNINNINNINNNYQDKSIDIKYDKDDIRLSAMSQNYFVSLFVEPENKNKKKVYSYFHKRNKLEPNKNINRTKSISFNVSPDKNIINKNQALEYIKKINIKNSNLFLKKKLKKIKKRKNKHKLNYSFDQEDDSKYKSIFEKSNHYKKKKSSQYEIDKFLYLKSKLDYENLKTKIEEMEKLNQRRKFQTSILNYDYNRPAQVESLFMKKLKEEKYRNVIRKLTTQRKIDKDEYNQLKLDLNISDSSEDYFDEEENENENEKIEENLNNNNNIISTKNIIIKDENFYENEINFYGAKIKIHLNQKEKDLYDKYIKLKKIKQKKDIQQNKTKEVFIQELEKGSIIENEESKSKINKKFVKKNNYKKRKSKNYFKFIKKKFIKSLDDEYDECHSDDSLNQEFNYFYGVDDTSLRQIERRKQEVLLKFKNDIIYKIKQRELTFNELSIYDELENKLKNFENNLSNQKYIKLLESYFNNLDKQLRLSKQRKMKEHRINNFMNNLIENMDILNLKKKKMEENFCHILNYKDYNHFNKLSELERNKNK